MANTPILDQINCPEDLKRLRQDSLAELCSEIREFLIENVSKTGGHLSANLGAVEISVGLHRVFSSPDDYILFDVGHQCYTHKILTGRKQRFPTLRQLDGLSGFLRPDESTFDSFISGHASNSISAALGMARASRLRGENRSTVCVIGDGALTGGMAYEALNDAGQSKEPFIVVFNDNEMSIGKNVGALAKRLSHMRSKPGYFKLKWKVKHFLHRFPNGDKVIRWISLRKNRLKVALLKESIFEIMGFRYLGPANGNDITAVCDLLDEAKSLRCPVVVHLKTVKGKGYFRSESSPDRFHGVAAFDVISGQPRKQSGMGFSDAFGAALSAFAESDDSICAVTAAMEAGTGLSLFSQRFPARFFDVGIAEEHAVTMSAGLAAGGMRPVCAIYSTFLQRGYDQLIHDVAIQKNHVVFAVDRAGLVGEDGQTHQGIFDVPYLTSIPNLAVFAPASHSELQAALRKALYEYNTPVAIRYPRGGEREFRENSFEQSIAVVRKGSDVTLLSYGILINETLAAAESLQKQGVDAEVLKLNCLTDYELSSIVYSVQKTGRLIVAEDCLQAGGMGEKIAAQLNIAGAAPSFLRLINLQRKFIPEGKVHELYQRYGIDSSAIAAAALEGMRIER